MVITKETYIPSDEELTVQEIDMSTSFLRAGAFFVGKQCEIQNNEYMLCREEEKDPRKCLNEGKQVTSCALNFFRQVKKSCAEEFTNYAVCIDKSSCDRSYRYCRNTQAIFETCMKEKLNMERPHIGYFCEARVHDSKRPVPPIEPPPVYPDALPDVPPPSVPRNPSKYGTRAIFGS